MYVHESPRSTGAIARSEGPAAATTVADDTDRHDCPESVIVWALLAGRIPAPNTWAFRVLLDLAEAMAQRKLAGIRPVLAHSGMWDSMRGPNRYDDLAQLRDTYDKPPKTPAQIRAEVRHSHTRWEREIAERWAS